MTLIKLPSSLWVFVILEKAEVVICRREMNARVNGVTHPSPRNNIWLSKNEWFETEVIPILQNQVKEICKSK